MLLVRYRRVRQQCLMPNYGALTTILLSTGSAVVKEEKRVGVRTYPMDSRLLLGMDIGPVCQLCHPCRRLNLAYASSLLIVSYCPVRKG